MPTRLAQLIDDRSARGIAAAVSRLITGGTLAAGDRLPTVRALARQLGVSPTTVSEAWQVLGQAGAIDARGRLGTFVVGPPGPPGPRRYRSITEGPGHYALDLSTGTPDPDLLPDLSAALTRVSRRRLTTSYLDDPVLPELGEVLRAQWPFEPEALTVVDGAMDALDRITTTVARLGDRVVVERASFPPLLDLLEQIGVEAIGVEVDAQGIVPESLAEALTWDPVALFTQPRSHNPLGVSITAARTRKLAALLRRHRTLVVEDDHAGDISSTSLASLGAHLPDRTVLIRSYSKSHGPDLRLAAVGGAADPIEQMVRRRTLGPGWSSRLLQAVLAELLVSTTTTRALAAARSTYRDRRTELVDQLRRCGVEAHGTDGINVWITVADERAAQVTLAARSIGVAPGTPFLVEASSTDHLRLTVSLLRDGIERLAHDIAVAASAGPGTRRPA
jgi:DNA-binding transcriptional MocR family regulator